MRSAAVTASVLAVAAVAAAGPAHAAWTDTQRLLRPIDDPGSRLGPVWVERSGVARALLLDDGALGAPGVWTLLSRAPGAAWTEAPADPPPAGLRPAAADPSGRLVATGLLATPAGTVVAAAVRADGAWGPVHPLSAPLPGGGAGVAPAAVIGPEGHAAVAWSERGVARAALIDRERVTALSGPGPGVPVVRINESGDAVAAWVRRTAAGDRIMGTFRPAGASAWTRPRPVPSPRGAPPGALAMDLDLSASGFTVLAWSAGRAGAARVWWTYATRPGGGWATQAPLTGRVGAARVEALRMSAAGDAVVVWSTATGLFTAGRPSGAPAWTADGRVAGAPGRGRAAAAPVQVGARRAGDVLVGWVLRDGVAVSSRPMRAGPWGPPEVLPTPPGPLVARVAAGEGGDLAAAWAVRSGVATGRVGAGVREGAAGPALTSAVPRMGPSGLEVEIGLAAPGRVHVEVTRLGAARPAGVVTADLPAGTAVVVAPPVLADALEAGRPHLVRVRTDGRDPGASVSSALITLPR